MSGIGSYRQSALPPSGELVRYCSLPSELQSPRCPVCPEIDRLCNSFDSFVITELGIYRNPFCLPCEEVFSNRHIRRSTEASVDDILGNTRSFHFSLLMNWVKAGEVTDQGTTGHWNIQPSSQRTKWRRLECPGGLDQPLPSTNCTVTDCIGEQDVWCDFDSTFYEIVLKLHLRCPRDHASVQAALTGMQEDGELVKTAVDTLQLDLNEFGLTVHSLLVEGASQEDLAFEGNAGEEGSRADLGSAGRSTGNPSDAPENPSASRLETGDSEGAPDAEHTDQGSKTSSASSLGEFQGKDTPGLTRQASDPKDDSRDPVVTDNPAMPETWNISLQVKQEDFTQGVPGLNVSQAVLGVVLQLCGLHRSEVDICMQRPRQVSKQVLPSRDRNCFVTYHSACPKKDPAGYSASSSPALRRTPDLMVALSTIAAITVMRMTVLGSVPA
ncbi:hypothetical protein BaRGS_00029825 [Batillaria attramentaria]|uniref:Uncharacterized protein n=1 Tax=Batillaria attramentaria TaxID=370345 RepID=A0ABD0JVQ6_9CAEN